MKNFIFKSTNADLQKMFQSIETIQKNVLYLTYQTDRIIKTIRSLQTDIGIKSQSDSYYEKSLDSFTDDEETSPQTDTDKQNELAKDSI